MGGCASRPKELDDELCPEPLPSDAPASETTETKEPVAQEESKGGEEQNEAPLVNLSEPKPEAETASSEPKTEAATEPVPVAADASTIVAEPAAEKKIVEAAAVPAPVEQKVEAVVAPVVADEKPREPKAEQPNSEHKAEIVAAPVVDEKAKEPKSKQPEAAPAKVEDQKAAPLVAA